MTKLHETTCGIRAHPANDITPQIFMEVPAPRASVVPMPQYMHCIIMLWSSTSFSPELWVVRQNEPPSITSQKFIMIRRYALPM